MAGGPRTMSTVDSEGHARYKSVVDEAAVRGVRAQVWDKSCQFTGWI